MSDFPIIDPHIHYWNPYTTPRSVSGVVKLLGRFPKICDAVINFGFPKATINYFGSADQFVNPFLPEIYFEQAGKYRERLKGVVHIQADWQAKKPLDYANETVWLDSLDRPPLAIVGEARLNDLDNLDALLDAHEKASQRFRGIRDMLAYHPSASIHNFNEAEDTVRTDAFKEGYRRLGTRGHSFDAFLFSHQLPDFCDLVEAVPETPVVVDHMGTPIGMMHGFAEFGTTPSLREQIKVNWMQGIQRLAQSEHVHMKLSGLFMHVLGWDHHAWSDGKLSVDEVVDRVGELLLYMIDTFGVDRCMFASNFPPDSVLMQYETYYDAYFQIVSDFSEADQKKLFHDNAARFYRIA
ncbi:MAG: amidohydrolase family protein [Chloroflexota bacterium]